MMKANYEKKPYVTSPLASLLVQTIKKIHELIKSYSDAPPDTLKQLNVLAAYLNVIHSDILPYFDNKTPGLLSLPGLLIDYGKLKEISDSLKEDPAQSFITPKFILFKEMIIAAFSDCISDFTKTGKLDKELLSNEKINANLNLEKNWIIFHAAKFAETDNVKLLHAEFKAIKHALLKLNLSTINFSGDIGQIISVVLELAGCFTDPEQSAAFKFNHPIFLELFVFLANQLETLPKEFKHFASFFKPETISELIPSLPGVSLKIVHQRNYKYTVEERTFDLPLIYESLHTLPRQLIIPSVASYMKQYIDNQFKLTALQRMFDLPELRKFLMTKMAHYLILPEIKDKALLPPFLNKVLPDSNAIQLIVTNQVALHEEKSERIQAHEERHILQIDSTLSGLEAIKHIDQKIRENAQLLEDNNALQKDLENDLLWKESFKLVWNKGRNCMENIPFGERINPLIISNNERVKTICAQLSNQQMQFPFLRVDAIYKWIEDIRLAYSDRLAGYQVEFSSIVHAVSQEDSEVIVKSTKVANKSIETREKDLEYLKTKVLNLNQLKTESMEWSQSYVPNIVLEVGGDASLEDALNTLSKELSVETHRVFEDMQATILKLKQAIANVQKELDDARFAETMRSANPEQMKQTIKDKEGESAKLAEQIKTEEAQLNKINEAIRLTCSEINTLQSTQLTQENDINKLNLDINLLLTQSKQISNKYQNINPTINISNEFSADRFTDWTDKEISFLNKLSEQCTINPTPDKNMLQLLWVISETFKKSSTQKDTKIPFIALETLIKTSDDPNRLFILLDLDKLDLGKADPDKEITNWKEYRDRQDVWYRIAPDEEQRTIAFDILSKAIFQKIVDVGNYIERKRDITTSLDIFLENKELFVKKNEEKIQCNKELVTIKSSINTLSDTKKQQELKQQSQLEAIETLKKQQQSLNDTTHILNLMITILEGIAKHDELIQSFCVGEALFKIEESIQPIEQSRNILQENMSLFDASLDKLDTNEKNSYQPKINQIHELLKNCDKNIITTMQSRYETTCIKPIPGYQVAYDELSNQYVDLIKNPNSTSIEKVMTQYDDLSKLVKVHQANVLSVNKVLTSDINKLVFTQLNGFYQCERNSTQQTLDTLNADLILLGANIEDHSYTLHIDEQTKKVIVEGDDNALIFVPNVAYPETAEQHRLNTSLLQEVEKTLREDFWDYEPLTKNPENLQALQDKINAYNNARTQAFAKLQTSQTTNDALAQRIENRRDLVAELKTDLRDYLDSRNPQFYFKDREERNTFVQELIQKLKSYNTSGNSAEVFEHIRIHRKQFSGGKLEHILNQLTAQLMDSDYQIPSSFVAPEQEEASLDHQAAEILTHFGADSDYYKRIMGLHDQVKAMRDFGETLAQDDACRTIATELADKLDEDIYRFVIKHPVNAPDVEAYARFQDKFTARSRSVNEVMQPYWPTWAAILANIAIGVASLGIALGIKAITSYVKTGESVLFFRQSNIREKVGEINQLAKEILLAPPVA